VFEQSRKDRIYDLVNGIGIFLRGTLQLVTTPLTYVFRIPLRKAITAGSKNPEYTWGYNRLVEKDGEVSYQVNQLPAFDRIAWDFKGTLAAYDTKSLGINLFVDFFGQPFRGLWNIVKGAVVLPLSVARLILSPFELLIRCVIGKEKVSEVFWGNRESKIPPVLPVLMFGAGLLLRGILQVVTTPLQWLIRMPLRGLITYHMPKEKTSGPSIEHEFEDLDEPETQDTHNPEDEEGLNARNTGRDVNSESFTVKTFGKDSGNSDDDDLNFVDPRDIENISKTYTTPSPYVY